MTINDCRIIELPKFLDPRGNLSFAENFAQIPFEIRRCYWIYDVPGGEKRDGHAYRENQEFIIAMSGALDVVVSDGKETKTFTLNRSYYGLYIPKGLWREMNNFSTNAFAMVFSSTQYDRTDYVFDIEEVKKGLSPLNIPNLPAAKVQPSEKFNVFDCTMVELDKHHSDRKGNLTVVENGVTFPFDVKRAYYIYDVPGGEERGSHAHKDLSQLIIAASGSFKVTLDDGHCKRTFFLNRPYEGLYVKPGMWRDLTDFSSGAVCMVLASDFYQKEDYIRDYNEFIKFRKER